MSNENAVINASPFILLGKCDLIELLPRMFGQVFMPNSVAAEIARGKDASSILLRDLDDEWLKLVSVPIANEVEIWNLGGGETEVLSFALASASHSLALVDDRAARRCANTLGIQTLGTAGLLVVAKSKNIIRAVKPELEKLESVGLYISDEVKLAIYRQAAETE